MKIVTSMDLGSEVNYEVIDNVVVSFVKARNVISKLGSAFKSSFGGHVEGIQKLYDDMRQEVLTEMENRAKQLGGDAIIALRIDVNEVEYAAAVAMFGYGTVVKVK